MKIDVIKSEKVMEELLAEVDKAIEEGNSPFAAFLLDKEGNIKFRAHNTSKSDCNPIAHAEINLIKKACNELQTRDLSDYYIISNAWSCSMCMSACIKAKIKNYIYGAPSKINMNPNLTIFDIREKCTNKINIIVGILEEKCKHQIEDAIKKNND